MATPEKKPKKKRGFEPRPGHVVQAYTFSLDPGAGAQARLRSHCGAARVAFNWNLARIKANLAQRQAGKNPVFRFFGNVPFGLTAHEHAAWLRFGGGQVLWEEAYAKAGVQPFLAGTTGPQAGGWFKKEIKSIEDLKGLKMRAGGMGGESFPDRSRRRSDSGRKLAAMAPSVVLTRAHQPARGPAPVTDATDGAHRCEPLRRLPPKPCTAGAGWRWPW
jgi:hypothetical protein